MKIKHEYDSATIKNFVFFSIDHRKFDNINNNKRKIKEASRRYTSIDKEIEWVT